MKKVNFDPELELKKVKIMEQFHTDNGPEEPAVTKQVSDGEISAVTDDELKDMVIDALKTVYDPEIPVNIFDLGLIYAVRIEEGFVDIDMTLTAPGCGMGDILVEDVRSKVELIPTVACAEVDLVFDPPWNASMMSEEARLEVGLFLSLIHI